MLPFRPTGRFPRQTSKSTGVTMVRSRRIGVYRIDAKKNELGTPVAPLNKPCGGAVNAFGSVWIPACGDRALVRIDPKTWKQTATVTSGVGTATPALAATTDSIWLLSDSKT